MSNPKLLSQKSVEKYGVIINIEDRQQPLMTATGCKPFEEDKRLKQYLQTQLNPFVNQVSGHGLHNTLSTDLKNQKDIRSFQFALSDHSNEKPILHSARNNRSTTEQTAGTPQQSAKQAGQQFLNSHIINKNYRRQNTSQNIAPNLQISAREINIRKQIEKRYLNSNLRHYRYDRHTETESPRHLSKRRTNSSRTKYLQVYSSRDELKSAGSQEMPEYQHLGKMNIVDLHRYHQNGKVTFHSRSSFKKKGVKSINRRFRTEQTPSVTPTNKIHHLSSKDIDGRNDSKFIMKHANKISTAKKLFTAGIAQQADGSRQKLMSPCSNHTSIKSAGKQIKGKSKTHRTLIVAAELKTPKRNKNLGLPTQSPHARILNIIQNGHQSKNSQQLQF